MLKKIQKIVCMTDVVFQAIDCYRGESFNDKLENFVQDYLISREQLEREFDGLQDLINSKYLELVQIQNRVRDAYCVEKKLYPLVDAVVKMLDLDID